MNDTPLPSDTPVPDAPESPRPHTTGRHQSRVDKSAPRNGVFSSAKRIFGAICLIVGLLVVGIYIGIIMQALGDDLEPITYIEGEEDEKIAILPVTNMIGEAHALYANAAVRAIIDDQDIKAVVLKVNSPGGGVSASDEIWHSMKTLRDKRPEVPLIAHFGGLAASGGYYIAMASDHIIAEPTCITASIGVIAQGFTLEKALNEKLGIKPETIIATGAVDKDVLDMTRDWTDRDRDALRVFLDAAHVRFTEIVAEGRDMKIDEARALATGRAMMAADALDVGLIDEIGYLDDALERARVDGKIASDNPNVIVYAPRRGLFEQFFGMRTQTPGLLDILPDQMSDLRDTLIDATMPRRMYLFQP